MAAIPGDAVDGVRVRKEILLSPGTEVFNLVGDVHLPVCTSCLKKEEKRAKLAEAAERRQKEAASRGILNVQSVEEKRKKKEKIEREMAASVPPPEGGLRWTVS